MVMCRMREPLLLSARLLQVTAVVALRVGDQRPEHELPVATAPSGCP